MEISITLIGFKKSTPSLIEGIFRKFLLTIPEAGRPKDDIVFYNHPTLNNIHLSLGFRKYVLVSPAIPHQEFKKIKGIFKLISFYMDRPFVLICHEMDLVEVAYKADMHGSSILALE